MVMQDGEKEAVPWRPDSMTLKGIQLGLEPSSESLLPPHGTFGRRKVGCRRSSGDKMSIRGCALHRRRGTIKQPAAWL